MTLAPLYHPLQFFSFALLSSFLITPLIAFSSTREGLEKLQLPLLFLSISAPGIIALLMIFFSGDRALIQDFWHRLFLVDINVSILAFTLLVMPLAILGATLLSLFFGGSAEQFSFTDAFSVKKGWSFFGIAIPLILAPLIEEIGWRGYGVDSLRASFNLFSTSLFFGILWGLWHVPVFFLEGYYHNTLWKLGWIYVLNFFLSALVVSFLMNWVYYKTARSIPALVLFHATLNFSSMVLKTEPFTKCLATLILLAIACILVFFDKEFFFQYKPLPFN